MKRFTTTCVALLVLFGVAAVDAHATDSLTLVLSNEAPGHLIDELIAKGYGSSNLYQALVSLAPSSCGVVPDAFLDSLALCPAGSEIFTARLRDYAGLDGAIGINADGTTKLLSIRGRDYHGQAGYATYPPNQDGVVRELFTYATSPQYYVDAGSSGTTHYKAFAIAWSGAQTTTTKTLVLSNEAPGYLIDKLIAFGYGSGDLYEAAVALAPASGGVISDEFLDTLASCPAGSEIFTARISNYAGLDNAIGINADGTTKLLNIRGSDYHGQAGYATYPPNQDGVERELFTYATSPQYYVDAGSGGTTHYEAFAIAWFGVLASPSSMFFPGVASSAGSGGTKWRSEAVLVNPGTTAQAATLDLIPRDGATVSKTATRTVQAGQLLRIADLYADLGAASGAGMLRVSGELLTWVRTFNQGAVGTFGQDVPPAALADAFAASTDVLFPVTTPADQTKEYRSNLLLVNLESSPITFTLTAGSKTATKIVPGGTYTQIDKVGTFLKLPAGLTVLAVRATGRWAGTVSTVDPGSGDPTTVRGLLPITRNVTLFPGVASVAGSLSTQWRSEAVLYNAETAAKTVLLEILPKDGSTVAASTSLQLQPKEVRRLADLYAELHAASGSGLLRVTGNVLAWVRTYNQGATATFGQDVPPVLPAGGTEAGSEVLYPVSKPGDKAKEFRSNLILYNHGTAKLTCTVTAGTKSRTTDVPAGAYAQVNDVGTWLGVPAGWTTITVKANGRWSGTVSTIDPFTGDPTTVWGIAR